MLDGPLQLIDPDEPLILGPDDSGDFDHTFVPALDGSSLDIVSQVVTAILKWNGRPVQVPLEGLVTTADATVTTALLASLSDARVYQVRATVVGVKTDGTARAGYVLRATVYRTGGGAATLQGAVVAEYTSESDATWNATLDVSGNDVRVRVTGVAATTIKWRASMELLSVGTADV